MNILLVHGMFISGCEFSRLRSTLEDAGHRCFMPCLKPFDASKGVEDLAKKLSVYIENHLPAGEPFVVIGFSMGCLISRVYIQDLGGDARVKAFFSISGPHYGSYLAYLYLGKGARDMRPGSRFLNRLNAYGDRFENIPTRSYRLKFDHVIIPSSSSDWGGAKSMLLDGVIHSLVPFNQSLIDDIALRLRQLSDPSMGNFAESEDMGSEFAALTK